MPPDDSLSDDQHREFEYRDPNKDTEGDAPDSSVLEDAIRKTVADESGEELRPEELEALLQVARRHPGVPFALEPVATDLVEALLTTRFASWVDQAGSVRDMAREIATSLFDTPETNERLLRLWQRLTEAAV